MRYKTEYTGGLIHAFGECVECGKEWNTKNAQGIVARHAQLTGHETRIDLGYCYTYRPEGSGSPKKDQP